MILWQAVKNLKEKSATDHFQNFSVAGFKAASLNGLTRVSILVIFIASGEGWQC